jgi:hypothetical protein
MTAADQSASASFYLETTEAGMHCTSPAMTPSTPRWPSCVRCGWRPRQSPRASKGKAEAGCAGETIKRKRRLAETRVTKRSIRLGAHNTSIGLEEAFW